MEKKFRDQLDREVRINHPSQRIISLVPSLSELLFELGLNKEVVGITKYCIHPKVQFERVEKIGGTKNIEISLIESLSPDLIIASKEENVKEQIEQIDEKLPVWVSDINNLSDALSAIQSIGEMTDKVQEANDLVESLKRKFESCFPKVQGRVVYMIWRKPYMTVGGDTFIHDMISRFGLKNVFAEQCRYPVITADDLKTVSPDFIFLSSEPYPFKEKHVEEFQEICPGAKILLVDGEYFSWYGSRLMGTISYFEFLNDKIRILNEEN